MEDKSSLTKSNLKIDWSAGKNQQINFKNDCFADSTFVFHFRVLDLGFQISSLGSRVSFSKSQLWDWNLVLGLWPDQKSLVLGPIFWKCHFYSIYLVHLSYFLWHASRLPKLHFIVFPESGKKEGVSIIRWKVIEICLKRPFCTNVSLMDTCISYNKY